MWFHLLAHKKVLDLSKLKAFADNKYMRLNILIFFCFCFWVENTFGKGENACYQYFLPFPTMFQKPPSLGRLVRIE